MSHKLTLKQVKALYLLAGGATTIDVGKRLKLRRETLSRWKQIPEFTDTFERIMEQVRGDMRHRLLHLVEDSITAVQRGMFSHNGDPRRLQTSLCVLKMLGIDRILVPNECGVSPDVAKEPPL